MDLYMSMVRAVVQSRGWMDACVGVRRSNS